MNWTVEGAVKFFDTTPKFLDFEETGDFYPATASLFNEESAVSGNEPLVVVIHNNVNEKNIEK